MLSTARLYAMYNSATGDCRIQKEGCFLVGKNANRFE
jgi:hypothetical protein